MAWWEDQKAGRKWLFQNKSSETMPGFACIGLDPSAEADRLTTTATMEWDKDARCIQARKPTALHEDLQNSRLIAFNLKDPVPKDGWGFCTFELPAVALIDRNEAVKVGGNLGPRAGCWHLSQVGDAFISLGEDPANPFDWTATVTIDGTSVSVHYDTAVVDTMPFFDRVVKTPAAGITARSGTTINSALCDAYREAAGSATTRTLTAVTNAAGDPYQVRVYNLSNGDIGGDRYVVTSRLLSGIRHVVVESCSAEA